MNRDVEKLEFKEKFLDMVKVGNDYWFSMKSLTSILNIDHDRACRNAKTNPLVKKEIELLTIEVEGDNTTQRRGVIFMSEKIVPTWLFTVISYTPENTLIKIDLHRFIVNRLIQQTLKK